jgi:hypothetical protein
LKGVCCTTFCSNLLITRSCKLRMQKPRYQIRVHRKLGCVSNFLNEHILNIQLNYISWFDFSKNNHSEYCAINAHRAHKDYYSKYPVFNSITLLFFVIMRILSYRLTSFQNLLPIEFFRPLKELFQGKAKKSNRIVLVKW